MARNESSRVLHVVADLFWIEDDRGPEVTEEVNHCDVHKVVDHRRRALERCTQVLKLASEKSSTHAFAHIGQYQWRQHQKTLSKNDRHDAGLVDLQRHVLASSAVHFASAYMFCTLRRDTTLGERDEHDTHDDRNEHEQQH